MAGRIAIEVALAIPGQIRSIALISPVALGRVRLIRLGRLSSKPLFDPLAGFAKWRALYRFALETAYGKLGTVEPKDVDEYWAQSQFPGFIAATRSLLGHFDWAHSPGRVAALRVPVTVFRGTRDRIVAADASKVAAEAGLELRALSERAPSPRTLLILEGAGHALNEEAPEMLNAALVAAVRGESAASR
jgi:pimeloyl-ACP methyl ester carboxylesterase